MKPETVLLLRQLIRAEFDRLDDWSVPQPLIDTAIDLGFYDLAEEMLNDLF